MFERNADNYSLRDQLALHKATVAVCGLGGGGGYVAEILARTGVGKFILIDGDCFEDSNRNRQIGALGSTLGRLKVEVMAERLRDVSPWVSVSAHPAFIGPETADLLSGADVVCDCVDGDNKRVLNALCRDRGVPYCTGGLSGERFQVGTQRGHVQGFGHGLGTGESRSPLGLFGLSGAGHHQLSAGPRQGHVEPRHAVQRHNLLDLGRRGSSCVTI